MLALWKTERSCSRQSLLGTISAIRLRSSPASRRAIRSSSTRPTQSFTDSQSKLFRLHCRGIQSETPSKGDFGRESSGSTLAASSARDSGASIEWLRGRTQVPHARGANSSRLQRGRGLETRPAEKTKTPRGELGVEEFILIYVSFFYLL